MAQNVVDGTCKWSVISIKQKFEDIKDYCTTEINTFKTTINSTLTTFQTTINNNLNSFRTSITTDMNNLRNEVKYLVPIGTILPFASNSTLPTGFTLCNGAAISRTSYPKLFSVIGTTYGAGNGSTTFNVPDLRNKFIEGYASSGSNIAAGLPNITGSFGAQDDYDWEGRGGWTGALYKGSNYGNVDGRGSGSTDSWHVYGFDASRSNAIYGKSSTVQPPAMTMRYIIRSY